MTACTPDHRVCDHDGPDCTALQGVIGCSRPEGHSGDHVTCALGRHARRDWPQEDQP